MALMLQMLFGLNVVLIALMLIEIFLLPNRLQRYLDNCTFRKERTNTPLETEEKEIQIMQSALQGTF